MEIALVRFGLDSRESLVRNMVIKKKQQFHTLLSRIRMFHLLQKLSFTKADKFLHDFRFGHILKAVCIDA